MKVPFSYVTIVLSNTNLMFWENIHINIIRLVGYRPTSKTPYMFFSGQSEVITSDAIDTYRFLPVQQLQLPYLVFNFTLTALSYELFIDTNVVAYCVPNVPGLEPVFSVFILYSVWEIRWVYGKQEMVCCNKNEVTATENGGKDEERKK